MTVTVVCEPFGICRLVPGAGGRRVMHERIASQGRCSYPAGRPVSSQAWSWLLVQGIVGFCRRVGQEVRQDQTATLLAFVAESVCPMLDAGNW